MKINNMEIGTYSAKFACARIARLSTTLFPSPIAVFSDRRSSSVLKLRNTKISPNTGRYLTVISMFASFESQEAIHVQRDCKTFIARFVYIFKINPALVKVSLLEWAFRPLPTLTMSAMIGPSISRLMILIRNIADTLESRRERTIGIQWHKWKVTR